MKLKKIIALLSSVTMLGAMSVVIPLTVSAAETTLLDQLMDSQEAVQAVIAEGKYEPMVAVNNGEEAKITLSHEKAGDTVDCLQMKNNNNDGKGWYNSAGLKYDITDLVAGKSGALTITADIDANTSVTNASIGFMPDGQNKIGCTSTTISSGEFKTLTYTADTIPAYNKKLYFYATTQNPTLRIKNLKLTLTTEDAALPIVNETFSAGSIPGYYTTTATAGLSADGTWLSASNVRVNNSDNIDENSEFITINIAGSQLVAGDILNIGFTYSNRNGSTKSAAIVSLEYGDKKSVSVGETGAVAGNGSDLKEDTFSKAITVPQDYTGGTIKIVLKVSKSTGAPKIKNVKISKVQTHKEAFTFTAPIEQLQDKTLKITAKNAENTEKTVSKAYSELEVKTTVSGSGDAVLGLIIKDIPEGTEITSVVFE